MRAIYLTRDLFFSSRITSLARQRGWRVAVAGSAEQALAVSGADAEPVGLLLVDLANMPGELDELIRSLRAEQPALHVLAYGPHVDAALLAAARVAGCDEVLTRGQFNQEAAAHLEARLGGGPG